MARLQVLLLIGFCCYNLSNAASLASEPSEDDWIQFKRTYNRNYPTEAEEQYRREVFSKNFQFIQQHNQRYENGEHSFRLGVNDFADLTLEEFRQKKNGYRSPHSIEPKQSAAAASSESSLEYDLPATVDWTTKGVVTRVKNQGDCGSCWAFATVASIESQHALKTGKLVELSEQELVDCAEFEGCHGCNGGFMDDAFHFVMFNGGIETEKAYPYKAVTQKCHMNQNQTVGASITNWFDIESNSESMLQVAIANVGPVATAIDASSILFQFYESGVYDNTYCSSTQLDHGVTVVGYGNLSGQQYWKVKNSWGATWGMDGYILMSRNKNNQCGIASHASYPIV